ncbi:MAG: alpha/beta fold hydrolase [Microbacteriaceae bacterium]
MTATPGMLAMRIVVLAGAAGLAAAAGTAASTVLVARLVVTPPTRQVEDARILSVSQNRTEITLHATRDSLVPGRYSLWFSGDTGYARIGRILTRGPRTVTRAVEAVDYGELHLAKRGRYGSWYFLHPDELGFPYQNVAIETDLGPAPAWYLPADECDGNARWVIMVHGRAAQRQGALRAIPVFRAAGYCSLLVSYRNDGEAPYSADRRYALGTAEWRDIEAGMSFAVEHGAREIVLMGWSMGGAIVLQTVARTALHDLVSGVILDSPVVDWVDTLHFHARLLKIPRWFARSVMWMIAEPWAGRFTGQGSPIDLDTLNFVTHADELDVPILLMHSDDDRFVPSTASRALSRARPDIVTFVPFGVARHTKLWNYDPDRWMASITDWLGLLRADRELRPDLPLRPAQQTGHAANP